MKQERLYIDCEFNDFRGELISMALVPAVGPEFYEVIPCDNPSEWVAANVMPILNKEPIPLNEMRIKLQEYLSQWDRVLIVADWPEDIQHFCHSVITGPGYRIKLPETAFYLWQGMEGQSELPHNALYDARANKDFGEVFIK